MIDLKGKSIAVVGSSGHLLEREYGKDIDAHDVIIRFNQARVEGFEKYVGSRTDLRIVNTHVFRGTTGAKNYSKYDKNFISKLNPQHILVSRPVGDIKKISPNNEVSIVSDKFYNHCVELLNNGKEPSVGFLGVILAVEFSDDVSVYGFDQNRDLKKKHYWEKVSVIGNHHKFSREKEIFNELEQKELITIFR